MTILGIAVAFGIMTIFGVRDVVKNTPKNAQAIETYEFEKHATNLKIDYLNNQLHKSLARRDKIYKKLDDLK